MDDELHDRLGAWGDERGPDVDPAFAQRLEADLRSAAYFAPRAGATPPRRRHPLLRPGFVLGALVLVALASAVLLARTGGDGTDVLVIEETGGATVTLPGGSSMPATDGTELPDGTIVEVSPAGFAVIGGIVLPPDSRALIIDGVVELLDVTPESTPTAAPSATPTSTPDVQIEVPPIGVTPEPEPTQRPQLEPAPTTRPTPTARPQPTPTTRPTATPEPRPTTSPAPDPTPTVAPEPEITLERSNIGPQRARLAWAVTDAESVRRFEVRIRRGDTIRTAAVLRRPDARQLVVERPERDRVFYRVLAIGEDGQVLARSNEVRVTSGENRPPPTPTDGEG